jgi:protein-S-isoprenylcysteine O-methyltransferase Ste14
MNKQYSSSKIVFLSVFIALFFPAVILLLSGNISWIEGWILSLWFDSMMLANIVYMYKKNPALISERLTASGSHNQKKWDKFLLNSLFVVSAIWISVMPLDAQRFHWTSDFHYIAKILGGLLLIPAFYFMLGATIANPYLSTVVRLQKDRKQEVISTGVYSFVRHPQYLGLVTLMIGGPLLLGSLLGLLLGTLIIMILVIRITGEEKMLLEELDGYIEYKERAKYRLFLYIW